MSYLTPQKIGRVLELPEDKDALDLRELCQQCVAEYSQRRADRRSGGRSFGQSGARVCGRAGARQIGGLADRQTDA